jgi:preprotein translocase subunit SecD
MDRNLKWRTIGLIGLIVFCLYTLAPSFAPKGSIPSWIGKSPFSHQVSKINLGLDLQGGLHVIYGVNLDRAVDDKASEIKRDVDAKFSEMAEKDPSWKDMVTASTPGNPVGTVIVHVANPAKSAEVESLVLADFKKEAEKKTCPAAEPAGTICVGTSEAYAESLRKDALHNAVTVIRERIDEKGIAEPSVVEKGDSIIVELPGIDDESIARVKDLIKRTAKLEFKLVIASELGQPSKDKYMSLLQAQVKDDPEAKAVEITATNDTWPVEDTSRQMAMPYLIAKDREESVSVCEAKEIDCYQKTMEVKDGQVRCKAVKGKHVIERYLQGIPRCGIKGLIDRKPDLKMPDGRQLGYELYRPERGAKDSTPYWRTYYLDRAVRLSGSQVSSSQVNFDPNTNKPIVQVEFTRYGGRLFGDLTSQNVGSKMAIILDDTVNSAPVINGPIRGGSAIITMGGSDPERIKAEADDLVAVLKTGSLPAPLQEESSAQVGPTLGRDAIGKAQLSFFVGILLVVAIMLSIYKWSGWVAIGAVTINVVMMMTAMVLFGATLTLPGVAALVLTVGMGVDGNILIYERIRDELTLGKSVRGAVDVGFSRAFTAILDGHMTTAAGGWVLLQYGSGPIKGFAVMLLVGIGTTLFCSTVVTRIFFDWVVARKKGANQTISI